MVRKYIMQKCLVEESCSLMEVKKHTHTHTEREREREKEREKEEACDKMYPSKSCNQ
jgi:hypothetical protein